ncbi:hypothetical protein I4U23_021796 [Adineta vaga]|nr:hypothetical protein I4U23_021796 [Adineta vaga]
MMLKIDQNIQILNHYFIMASSGSTNNIPKDKNEKDVEDFIYSSREEWEEINNAIQNTNILNQLSEYKCRKLMEKLELKMFENDELIVKKGDVANEGFVIVQGVAIICESPHQMTITHELKTFDTIGLNALYMSTSYNVDVIANGRVVCVKFYKQNFDENIRYFIDECKIKSETYRSFMNLVV